MARDFDGTTQYGSYTAGVPVSGVPLTICCRFAPDTITDFRSIVALTDGGGGEFFMLGTDSDALRAIAASGFSEAQAYASGTFAASGWHTGVAVFASSTSRTCYLDGDTSSTAETTSMTPGTMSQTNLSHLLTGNLFDGDVCDVAIYNVAWSTADVTQFHNGYSPLFIRPSGLVAYWPIIGRFSPEIDVIGGQAFTLTGSPSVSDHAPVIFPKKRRTIFAGVSATTYNQSINANAVGTAFLRRQANLIRAAQAPHGVTARRSTTFGARSATAVRTAKVIRQGNLTRSASGSGTASTIRMGLLNLGNSAVVTASVAFVIAGLTFITITATAVATAYLQRQANLTRSVGAAGTATISMAKSLTLAVRSVVTAIVSAAATVAPIPRFTGSAGFFTLMSRRRKWKARGGPKRKPLE